MHNCVKNTPLGTCLVFAIYAGGQTHAKNGIAAKQDAPAANLQRFKEFGMHK